MIGTRTFSILAHEIGHLLQGPHPRWQGQPKETLYHELERAK